MGKPNQYGRNFGYKFSNFGSDTNGHDVKAFGDTTGKYFMWDASANTLYVVGTLSLDGTFAADNIALADAETLTFGTGNDVVVQWDGTNLIFAAAADDSLIEIGDSAATQLSFDIKWYGNEANGASYVFFDASANLIYTTGVDLQFKDSDFLVFGTGAGAAGDVSIAWDGTNLVMASVAAASVFNVGAASFVINTTQHGTYTVGVDDTGYDVKFFGATTGKYLLWDESADKLILISAFDITGNSQFTGTVSVGVDDTGHDVKFFGATAGVSMLWDESADQLIVTGNATAPALKLAGAGSISAAAYAATGAAWADGGTPAFAADQAYMLIDIAGTTYRLPLFANA